MTSTHPTGQTAKIYVFPLRERAISSITTAQKFAVMEAESRRAVAAAGDGWYHDAAIAEAAGGVN